jgi:hypothetical protein
VRRLEDVEDEVIEVPIADATARLTIDRGEGVCEGGRGDAGLREAGLDGCREVAPRDGPDGSRRVRDRTDNDADCQMPNAKCRCSAFSIRDPAPIR